MTPESIVLSETHIVRCNGHDIDPVPVKVVQRLWPHQRLVIECDQQILHSEKGTIELKEGRHPIDVLSPVLETILLPVLTPYEAVPPTMNVTNVTFGVFNFPDFYGSGQDWIDYTNKDGDSYTRFIPSMELFGHGYKIDIRGGTNERGIRNSNKDERRFYVSHTGRICCVDQKPFRVDAALGFLKELRLFLSFMQCHSVSLIDVTGTTEDGQDIVIRWGSEYINNETVDRRGIMSGMHADARQAFAGFSDLMLHTGYPNIRSAMGTFVYGADGHMLRGLPTVAIALETLSKIPGMDVQHWNRPSAGRNLKKMLANHGIPVDVPTGLSSLDKFRRQEGLTSGAEAVMRMRNLIVHEPVKADSVPWRATQEAYDLIRWYVEMIILKLFGYNGHYLDRRARAGDDHDPLVPWATTGSRPAAKPHRPPGRTD